MGAWTTANAGVTAAGLAILLGAAAPMPQEDATQASAASARVAVPGGHLPRAPSATAGATAIVPVPGSGSSGYSIVDAPDTSQRFAIVSVPRGVPAPVPTREPAPPMHPTSVAVLARLSVRAPPVAPPAPAIAGDAAPGLPPDGAPPMSIAIVYPARHPASAMLARLLADRLAAALPAQATLRPSGRADGAPALHYDFAQDRGAALRLAAIVRDALHVSLPVGARSTGDPAPGQLTIVLPG